jgi:hypothetical protein
MYRAAMGRGYTGLSEMNGKPRRTDSVDQI